MECECYIKELLHSCDNEGVCVSVWNRKLLGELDIASKARMSDIINIFGRRSCKAQRLGAPVTDWLRMCNGNHRLYVASMKAGNGTNRKMTTILGILKTGEKKLFLRPSDLSAQLKEVEPICVLDFYVHESCQRQGIGLKLMNGFFKNEGSTPDSVAYDR